MYIVQEL